MLCEISKLFNCSVDRILDPPSFVLRNMDFDYEFIAFACKQIEHGYPVIIIPKEYTDTIFAIVFSDRGQTLKGLGFLDGDDQKMQGQTLTSLINMPVGTRLIAI